MDVGGDSYTASAFSGSPLPEVKKTILSDTLDFVFTTSCGSVTPCTIVNNDDGTGTNTVSGSTNWFLTFGNKTTTTGNVVWLFVDDGGAGPNDNHDDFVVRISAVPLPAGVLLLGLALGGLAVYRRRAAA
jgi:hypothetical protein